MQTSCVGRIDNVGAESSGVLCQTLVMYVLGCKSSVWICDAMDEPVLGIFKWFVRDLAWANILEGFCVVELKSNSSLSSSNDAKVSARGAQEKGAAFGSKTSMLCFVSAQCFLG